MSPDDEGHHGPSDVTGSQSWQTGRRWARVTFVVIACVMTVALVGIVAAEPGDVDVASIALNIAVIAFAVYGALTELKGRVEVDATGVHRVTAFRRRTYPWEDVVEIRPGRRVKGTLEAELVRHGATVVALPNSGQHVADLRRWHAAATRD